MVEKAIGINANEYILSAFSTKLSLGIWLRLKNINSPSGYINRNVVNIMEHIVVAITDFRTI